MPLSTMQTQPWEPVENLEAAEVSEADKHHPLLKDVKPLRKEDL